MALGVERFRAGQAASWCVLVAASVVSVGCGSAEPSEAPVLVHSEETQGLSWEDYRDVARRVSDGREYFQVEEDLYFTSEAELRLHYDSLFEEPTDKLAVFVRPSDSFEPTFAPNAALDIRYCVSNLFQTTYSPLDKARVVSEMASATQSWQAVANVRFEYLPGQDATCSETNANVDFAVLPSNSGTGGCAANKLMWYGGCPKIDGTVAVGGLLTMGGYSSITTNPSSTGVLRHELGHMLGFRHEHPWKGATSGCGEAQTNANRTGRRLTPYDSVSVMHYTDWSVVGCGPLREFDLTDWDGVGARAIYGMPAAWHVGITI